MANYESIEEIFGTIENATVIRNNSKNDDGVDTLTGVDWFFYQGVLCENFYVSGDSWIGFGSNTEHLKVNRRDAASWYIWREEGTLFNFYKFLRIRWQGYSRYNYSSTSYLLTYDVIFWESGDITLHMLNIPTSYYNGTFSFGSLNYTVPSTASPDITFKLQEDGSYLIDYSLINLVRKNYLKSGGIEFEVDLSTLPVITKYLTSSLNVEIEKPEGTDVKIFVKQDSGAYVEIENNSEVSCFLLESDLSQSKLYIRFDLSTEDVLISPKVKGINLIIRDYEDEKIVVLILGEGNLKSMQNAVGDIIVSYDGSGSLMGVGGPVAAFEKTFSPIDLINKINPMNAEHIELTKITPIGSLKKVYYMNAKTQEHIELMNIVPTGVLTKIDDI